MHERGKLGGRPRELTLAELEARRVEGGLASPEAPGVQQQPLGRDATADEEGGLVNQADREISPADRLGRGNRRGSGDSGKERGRL